MANLKDYEKLTTRERQNRYFSEDFKRKKVAEIERNRASVSQVCREYQVSHSSVYKWIYKYSNMRKKGVKQIVESKSDTQKILALQEQIKELQRVVGEKQILLDFKDKMIEIAEKEYGVDIKKKFPGKRSSGTGSNEKTIK
jgi:transposase